MLNRFNDGTADPESLNAPIHDVDAPEDAASETANTSDIEWKVLVLDTQARNVISAVLRMNDLRAAGVGPNPEHPIHDEI